MQMLSKIISFLAAPVPFSLLVKSPDKPPLLPFYHLVNDSDHPFQYNYNFPSVRRFREDLDFLLKYFTPISLEELYQGRIPRNAFHLSFDDGLRQCFELAAPVLKEKGVPATFFVNPAFVDNSDLFHRYKAALLNKTFEQAGVKTKLETTYADLLSLDQIAEDIGVDWKEYLEKEQPYMTLEQLRKLDVEGFTIGAHSWDHPEFWLLDDMQQLEEIRESMEWLEANFSPPVKAFAFPFTDFGVSDKVFETMRAEKLCDISFGTAGLKFDDQPFHFQRLAMEISTAKSAKQILKDEYLSFHLKKLVNKQIARRSAQGEVLG